MAAVRSIGALVLRTILCWRLRRAFAITVSIHRARVTSVIDGEHRLVGNVIELLVVEVQNLAGGVAQPRQRVFVGNAVPRAHAGEGVPKRVQLVLVGVLKTAA